MKFPLTPKLPYVVARKSKKPYMGKALEAEVISITTEVPQKLYIDEKDLSVLEGKKVALVDDVVSTGAIVEALKKLVAKAGGQVAQIVAVFTEGDQEKWQDATRSGHLPVFKE
ncbi:MAG: phosphoribosyltransferase family protein [Patescibacteria group bacterium]|nr:phosphoribosyltransferase family protein [Patescibacteria group bacterium]